MSESWSMRSDSAKSTQDGCSAGDFVPDPLRDAIEVRRYWNRADVGDGFEGFHAMVLTLRASRLVIKRIEDVLRNSHNLNVTDYLLLMTLMLNEEGSELLSVLARSLLVHPTTATLATDRLSERGLLRRQNHPTDRRAILATITAKGRKLCTRATDNLAKVGFGFGDATEARAEQIGKLIELLEALG
jgi:DNA-binding MarR family transcriptional regulator